MSRTERAFQTLLLGLAAAVIVAQITRSHSALVAPMHAEPGCECICDTQQPRTPEASQWLDRCLIDGICDTE